MRRGISAGILLLTVTGASCSGDPQLAGELAVNRPQAVVPPPGQDTSLSESRAANGQARRPAGIPAPRPASTEPFPAVRRIAAIADGALQASLHVSASSCVPGTCICVGEFRADWNLNDWGVEDRSLRRGTVCSAADFDGDGDWDAVIPGGEGFAIAIMMNEGRPTAAFVLDLGGAFEIVRTERIPRTRDGIAVGGYSLRVDQGRRTLLFEWDDSSFTRREVPSARR
jgi:hypothetical protein